MLAGVRSPYVYVYLISTQVDESLSKRLSCLEALASNVFFAQYNPFCPVNQNHQTKVKDQTLTLQGNIFDSKSPPRPNLHQNRFFEPLALVMACFFWFAPAVRCRETWWLGRSKTGFLGPVQLGSSIHLDVFTLNWVSSSLAQGVAGFGSFWIF